MSHIPILVYHALDSRPSPISLSIDTFAAQMRTLYEARYQVLPLGDVVRAVRESKPLPKRAVSLTFDDGFVSIAYDALPILSHYGFPATAFLVTDYVGLDNGWRGQPSDIPRLPLLTWNQARTLVAAGVELGAHTASHPRLDVISHAEVIGELKRSQRRLQDETGRPADLFAYPYGRWTPAVRELVGHRFRGAVTMRPTYACLGMDPLTLGRIDARYLSPNWLVRLLGTPTFRIALNLLRDVREAGQRKRA